MDIIKTYDEDRLTISVNGEIDTVAAPDLENEITDEMGKFDSLIFDFEKLEYLSSAALGVLISTQKKLQGLNRPFVITNTPESIKEIFSTTGVDKFLNVQ